MASKARKSKVEVKSVGDSLAGILGANWHQSMSLVSTAKELRNAIRGPQPEPGVAEESDSSATLLDKAVATQENLRELAAVLEDVGRDLVE